VAEPAEADYVIVGAGAAGCVLASRLSASGRERVLVLEAGGADRHLAIRVPAGFRYTIGHPRLNWGYKTAPGTHIGARVIDFPRGRVLGGSSSINGHLFVRGQAADYDHWAQLGCRGWSWDDVLPHFMRAETRPGGDPAARGGAGPLIISDQREPHPLCQAFFDAAATLGLAPNPDYNAGEQEGTGLYQQMMRSGRRWSAADAYLRPALGRPNLALITGALVEGIALQGRRATGVRYRLGDSGRTALARRAVILAGGAINSPQLLQLSGIGDGAQLQALGVPVVHHLPGVGQNLRDHYAVRMAWRVAGVATLNERSRGLRLAGELLKYALLRRGLLAMSPGHGAAFLRTRPELATPDVQFFFSPASYEGGQSGRAPLERQPGMTLGCTQLRPESRGWVRACSPDPREPPEIQPNYLADEIDRAALLGAMRWARRVAAAPPLAGFVVTEAFPGPAAASDADLLDHACRTGGTIYHPIGSCRMGADPQAVVDPALKVNGIEGLRVIDASVMPTMPSGNTYAPTIMVAEKGAALIIADALA
jgi:choline dehydrogenase